MQFVFLYHNYKPPSGTFSGGTADLASISFFISSGTNKRRSAEAAISNEPLYFPQNNPLTENHVLTAFAFYGFANFL